MRVASKGEIPLLTHNPLDVFHHHDRVVDQETDCEHHGKHGQHIDGKAEEPQHRKRSQDHHGDCDGWNQGRPHVAHETEHHEENQDDRFEQGLDHLFNGDSYERRGIVRIHHFHARREELAHLFHLGPDVVGRIERVGARGLANGQTGRGPAVVVDIDVVGLRPQFRAPDVPNPHNGTVRIRA